MQKPFPFSIDRWLIIWKGCTVISLRQASGPLWKLTLIALYKHLAFFECCYWFFLSIFKCRNNTEQIAGPMILHEDLVPLQIATTMVTVKHGERKKERKTFWKTLPMQETKDSMTPMNCYFFLPDGKQSVLKSAPSRHVYVDAHDSRIESFTLTICQV